MQALYLKKIDITFSAGILLKTIGITFSAGTLLKTIDITFSAGTLLNFFDSIIRIRLITFQNKLKQSTLVHRSVTHGAELNLKNVLQDYVRTER